MLHAYALLPFSSVCQHTEHVDHIKECQYRLRDNKQKKRSIYSLTLSCSVNHSG